MDNNTYSMDNNKYYFVGKHFIISLKATEEYDLRIFHRENKEYENLGIDIYSSHHHPLHEIEMTHHPEALCVLKDQTWSCSDLEDHSTLKTSEPGPYMVSLKLIYGGVVEMLPSCRRHAPYCLFALQNLGAYSDGKETSTIFSVQMK
jgi:hypothetical protein